MFFLHKKWGDEAYQVKSGFSIVIFEPKEKHVYKHPLELGAASKMNHLIRELSKGKLAVLKYSAIPISSEGYQHEYFMFNMYRRPINVVEAKNYIAELTHMVVRAIKELHETARLVHLDVRLDNICFDHHGEAVLIDLDRSLSVDADPDAIPDYYGKSTMYSMDKKNWTMEKYDWRQLAIMLLSIVIHAWELSSLGGRLFLQDLPK